MNAPRFIKVWVADVALRLIFLANHGLILKSAQNQDFLWSSWRNEAQLGTVMIRKLFSPKWNHQDIYENTATTADGYGYKFFDFRNKK